MESLLHMNMNNEENTLCGIARENDGCCWKVFSTRNITLSIFNYEFQSIVGFGGVIAGGHILLVYSSITMWAGLS